MSNACAKPSSRAEDADPRVFFTPVQTGFNRFANRIAMAPPTRGRAWANRVAFGRRVVSHPDVVGRLRQRLRQPLRQHAPLATPEPAAALGGCAAVHTGYASLAAARSGR